MPTNPMTTKPAPSPGPDPRDRAKKLGLWGLVAHWDEVEESTWVEKFLGFEEEERRKRSLELKAAKVPEPRPGS